MGWKEDYGTWWDIDRHSLRCIKCDHVTELKSCPNCGSKNYEQGTSTEGVIGAFCKKCKKGFTNWICAKCDTENPVEGTVVKWGVCFIATAVYGSHLAKEVVILQSFRDNVLARTTLGRVFIKGYNRFSQFYARLIGQSRTLRKLVRATIISPLVRLVEYFLK